MPVACSGRGLSGLSGLGLQQGIVVEFGHDVRVYAPTVEPLVEQAVRGAAA